jgi:hypothetical protein
VDLEGREVVALEITLVAVGVEIVTRAKVVGVAEEVREGVAKTVWVIVNPAVGGTTSLTISKS